jgi:hypothetical protein
MLAHPVGGGGRSPQESRLATPVLAAAWSVGFLGGQSLSWYGLRGRASSVKQSGLFLSSSATNTRRAQTAGLESDTEYYTIWIVHGMESHAS